MNIFILTIIIAVISFLITYSILKWYIPYANKNNLTGIDVHKINKPNIANYGGFAIIIGFVISTLISFIFLDSYLISIISLILITIIIVAIIGIYDDLKELSIIKKILLCFLSTIPLIIAFITRFITIDTILFNINFGLAYYLIFIPIYFAIFANMTNMLAGYNGLETGMGIITISSLTIILILSHNFTFIILLISYISSLIAFYLFNKNPAKVFMGDVATLTIGALIAIVAIFSNIEIIALLLCIPYLIHFILYAIYLFIYRRKYGDPKISSVDKKEILTPMYFDKDKKIKAWHKLYFLFEHWFYPLTEKKLVELFITIQFCFNLILIILLVFFWL